MKKFYLLLIALLFVSVVTIGQVVRVVNCETAGTLRTLLSTEEFNTVTDLTVTGQIDMRDFSVFRDMSTSYALRILDISALNVVEYITSGGTNYAANNIYRYAFQNCRLSSLKLPNTVTQIEESGLYGCSLLETVTMPEALISIGNSAFSGCSKLAIVNMNPNLQNIHAFAFANCTSLTNIVLPKQTKYIAGGTFNYCSKLSAINVASDNVHYSSLNGILYNYNQTVLKMCPAGLTGSVVIPEGVTSISDSAFLNCSKIDASITLPTTLKTIGNSAFQYCTQVTGAINLPNGLTEIGDAAFNVMSKISGEIKIPSTIQKLGKNAFMGCANLNSVKLECVLDTIPYRLFYGCNNLNGSLIIPDGVKVIDKEAFFNCKKFSSIDLPSSVISIFDWAFYGISSLEELSLPENVVVYESAFSSCSSLKVLKLKAYASLFSNVFASCSALESIVSNSANPPYLSSSTFNGVNKSSCVVSVAAGSLSAYRGSYNWKAFSNIVEIDNGFDPELKKSYPEQNQLNVSVQNDMQLHFNENVIVRKSANIVDNANSQVIAVLDIETLLIKDSTLMFELGAIVENSKSYSIQFPQGFVEDSFGNPWPKMDAYTLAFTTSPVRSTISIDFLNDKKENMVWTTLSSEPYYDMYILSGYWAFDIKGMPMRWYKTEWIETENAEPVVDNYGPVNIYSGGSFLELNLQDLTNTITNVRSRVYENACSITTTLYNGITVLNSDTVTGTNNSAARKYIGDYSYVNQQLRNPTNSKIDLIKYSSLEGYVLKIDLEIIDIAAPVVELGLDKVICEGDSVVLDAGFTPGAIYAWNTGQNTRKIIAKTSASYSVSVKNTIAEVSDNVLVTVRPIVHINLPDTIMACVGDTVTLSAGTSTENDYLWSPTAETTPSIKVTQSGMYHVIASNGVCLATDSVRVIFKGASLGAYFYQGGMTGYEDVRGELYKKNNLGKFELYRYENMPQIMLFDSLPAGSYILKAHFVDWTFMGENPFLDTYHDGQTEWSKVVPFNLTCVSDTSIGFPLANKPYFEFNGSAVISGKIDVVSKPMSLKIKAIANVAADCDTKVLLFDGNGNLIAETCPDAEGNFSFSNLPAGNYSIGIERTGYVVAEVFTATVSEGETVSNAYFTVDENSQSVEPGLTTKNHFGINSNFSFSVSPNPMHGNGILKINVLNQCNAFVSILDLTGKLISTNSCLLIQGENKIEISTNNLNGLYFIKVVSAEGAAMQRVLMK